MTVITDDPRIDPRTKATVGAMPSMSADDVTDRQTLLDEVNAPEAIAQQAQIKAMMDMIDNEEIAPSADLSITEHEFIFAAGWQSHQSSLSPWWTFAIA